MSTYPSLLIDLLGAFALVAIYALFVCAGVALTSSRSTRLQDGQGLNPDRCRLARLIHLKSEIYLLTAQVGMFLTAVLIGFCIMSIAESHMLIGAYQLVHDWLPLPQSLFTAICVFSLALLALAGVQLSRSIALARPEETLCFLSLPLIVSAKLFAPVLYLIGPVARLLRLPEVSGIERADSPVTGEEMSKIVEMSSEAGEIPEGEGEMLQGVLSLSDTSVREVMTPRKEFISIRDDASLCEITAVLAAKRVSRLIVTGKEADDVRGVLIAKDLFPLIGRTEESFEVRQYIRPPFFVPDTKKTDELLEELRRNGNYLAIVLDEHGSVVGLVTVEDLVEEIVGEIFDEYDSPAEETGIRRTKSGDYLVSGTVRLADLNEKARSKFPVGEYDTIAGFVMDRLGHIPEVGEILVYRRYQLRVEKIDQNSIALLRISKIKKKKLPDLNGRAAPSGATITEMPLRPVATGTSGH